MMERVVEELERADWMMRLETSGIHRNGASRLQLQGCLHTLQQVMGRGSRRRYAALATRFDLEGHGALRDMVERWSVEEEQREREAEMQLWRNGESAETPPLDAMLWEAYFDSIAVERPMATLGALAAWERLRRAAFELSGESQRTDELCESLRRDDLDDDELNELADGVSVGALMGLRLIRWGLGLDEGAIGSRAWQINRLPAGRF